MLKMLLYVLVGFLVSAIISFLCLQGKVHGMALAGGLSFWKLYFAVSAVSFVALVGAVVLIFSGAADDFKKNLIKKSG